MPVGAAFAQASVRQSEGPRPRAIRTQALERGMKVKPESLSCDRISNPPGTAIPGGQAGRIVDHTPGVHVAAWNGAGHSGEGDRESTRTRSCLLALVTAT